MSFIDDDKRVSDEEHSPQLKAAAVASEEDLVAEQRLVRRLDLRILPIASLLYFVACAYINLLITYPTPIYPLLALDRGNLGNALTLPEGIDSVLPHGDPTGKQFDWINSIFFFSYVSFQGCRP
jgi:hypothetical protein